VRAGVAASTVGTAQAQKHPTVVPAEVHATVAAKNGEQLRQLASTSAGAWSANISLPGLHRGKDLEQASGPITIGPVRSPPLEFDKDGQSGLVRFALNWCQ
jgi:hypothetical protein